MKNYFLTEWFKQHPIYAFFLLTFVIAWVIWIPLGIFLPDQILFTLLGAWAPTFSALILIGLAEGKNGIRLFLKKLLHWRVGLKWYLIVLFSVAGIAYISNSIGLLFDMPTPELTLPVGVPKEAILGAIPFIFLINIFVGGPLAEDIGWRGYILPKLREKTSAFNASIIIGVIWAIWHLPYFIFPQWHSAVGNTPFFLFMLLTTAWSVLFAWVYINTESILMPVLFHAAINTTLGTLGILGNVLENNKPLMIHTIFTWLVVGILLLFAGKDLSRNKK